MLLFCCAVNLEKLYNDMDAIEERHRHRYEVKSSSSSVIVLFEGHSKSS